ncbi:hypothetical protein UlMin_034607 [Ulmus minor]
MDIVNKIGNLAARAANSNAVVNTCLVGSFVVLAFRSISQQNDIETLEAQKESLLKSNKAMKKTMWDWKQQLYAEAESDSALVPLSRLKAIYGDVTTAQNEVAPKEDDSSSESKFMV